MLDELDSQEQQLEDDEFSTVCWEAPAVDRARCDDCLAYLLRNGKDRATTPRQSPTLSWSEEKRVRAAVSRQQGIEWLMLPEADRLDPAIRLRELIARPRWQQYAACKDADTDLFFPERGSGRPVEALGYCEQCAVRPQCLASALEHSDYAVGVWGGTSQRERRAIRQRQSSVA